MSVSSPSDILSDCINDPNNMTETQTRKAFIDKSLKDAGWIFDVDCKTEAKIFGVLTPSGSGFADYILYVDGKPCVVVEAKKTSVDPNAGYAQAKDYAASIKSKTSVTPIIFLTNGKSMIIDDGSYPLRRISGFYSPDDVSKWLQIRSTRDWKFSSSRSLDNPEATISVRPPKFIEERLYQCRALNKTVTAFARGKRRSLLVMATGSGKTRVVNAISKILVEYHWATRILFLVDRKELVNQAGHSFTEHLNETVSIIHSDSSNKNYDARILVSCYPSMMTAIQNEKVGGHPRFTTGYFDLIVIDEAHRSVYNKYMSIIDHFDALVVGLTATPKDSIDCDTYELFDIYDKKPTFEYTLEEGVEDGYLCPPRLVRPRTSILTSGVDYKDLDEEGRKKYEDAFTEDDGSLPLTKEAQEFYGRIFNENTMKIVFKQLEDNGLTVDYGNTLGKTIIFAPSHLYAVNILETFKKFHTELCMENPDYIKIIDYESCKHSYQKKMSESGELEVYNKTIEDFKNNDKFRIAISVDMLTTGVDIPSILNLVFYRKVRSNVLLQQMIGRGTRTCKKLIDGRDKSCFYIFDYCNNDFSGKDYGDVQQNMTLSEKIFILKIEMISLLQNGNYSSEEYTKMRSEIVDSVIEDINNIDRNNFIVKDFHLPYVIEYSMREKFDCLDDEDRDNLRVHIAPVVCPYKEEVQAERFDALMYQLEAGALTGTQRKTCIRDLQSKAKRLRNESASIGRVTDKLPLLNEIIDDDDIGNWTAFRFEKIRRELRDIMQYVPKKSRAYISHLHDDLLDVDFGEINLEVFGTEDYHSKVNAIIDKYIDSVSIQKIYHNESLSNEDLEELQDILSNELNGSMDKFEEVFGGKSLKEVVRRHVGLDSDVVDEAFKNFILSHDLTDEMYQFVSKIMVYLKHNGILLKQQLIQQPFSYGLDYLQKTFGNHLESYLSDIGDIIDLFNRGVDVV